MQERRQSRQTHVHRHFIDLEYRYQPHCSHNVSCLHYQSTLAAALTAPDRSVFTLPLGNSLPNSTLTFRLHNLLKLLHKHVKVLNGTGL